MNGIYQKKYSLEEIANLVQIYYEQFSDITNFRIVKEGNSYICIDTVFVNGECVPKIKVLSEYEMFLLFKKVSPIPSDTINYFHLSSNDGDEFCVGYNLIDRPRTRKH